MAWPSSTGRPSCSLGVVFAVGGVIGACLFVKRRRENKEDSKKKLATLCLAACLAAALATPAGALDYAIDAPEGPDYGKPTSVEVVHTADGGALKNEDISKNAALIPPGFGSASADTLNTGTWLTPNLAPEGMAVGAVNGSGMPVVFPPSVDTLTAVPAEPRRSRPPPSAIPRWPRTSTTPADTWVP